ncbi:GH92 family glycosyl hydrolase [Arachidicoccus terrestris]|uniref:GH92 family glycosyl hydrolase n=1 Tax=Arachidicoccus terrestris TaxID=2875539 RepID=UPI001CC74A1E|nr:GH92 family glycosyl hydrolase [Arachidicoccus terrestris]
MNLNTVRKIARERVRIHLMPAFLIVIGGLSVVNSQAQPDVDRHTPHTVWQIGAKDGSRRGMALAPGQYNDFLKEDFGWEDKFFLIGYSNPRQDWPYVLPGPVDSFGGTSNTAGVRNTVLNILFGIKGAPGNELSSLVIDLAGYQAARPAKLKVTVNGHPFEYALQKGKLINLIKGNSEDLTAAHEAGLDKTIRIPTKGLLREGGNEVQITSVEGSWIVFDQVRLEAATPLQVLQPGAVFLRQVRAARYEVKSDSTGKRNQPLLIDVQHLKGRPDLSVQLDGKKIFHQVIDTGRFDLEVPMPAVRTEKQSSYKIFADDQLVSQGKVKRSPQPLITPANYIDTKMGTAHSRWMIAPGPWMPFSMVKLSPDNQDAGWSSGYDPMYSSIGTFSHIHEWTLSGLGTFPTSGPLKLKVGRRQHPEEGYRSRFDPTSEVADVDYYKVRLTDHNILAELTATTRCSFQKYTYPKEQGSRIMIDLMTPAEYNYILKDVTFRKVNDYRIEGSSHQFAPKVWSDDADQDYTIHFVIEFDRPIAKFGTWNGDQLSAADNVTMKSPKTAGAFVEFDTRVHNVVQMRTGISLVSVHNAAENLKEEITKPFGWNFDKVRENNLDVWNGLLSRIKIESDDAREKKRFYTNMYRAICSRNTWSDVNGQWVDANEKVQKLSDQDALALGCDAFWNTFWNLNQFWNLAYPDWSSKWVKSQLAMYDANGWLAKGPAGMNYIPVMVAEHEIPLIVAAYQMGIRDFDVEKALKAAVKMQTTPSQKVGKSGYAGNRDLLPYLKHHYVPGDKGRFSNTLEYSYDDWTVGQLAKSLGKGQEYKTFNERGSWWKNAIDTATGYARIRNADGKWMEPFDPFRSGANSEYVEGNAWQLTYYVPQDVPGLIKRIGADRFAERLNWGFKESEKLRFNAPGDQYWDYPVIQGNEQSMQFAFLFNWVKMPWLTQKWSRSILDRYYGYGLANAYLGDEDQGQMSGWFVMAALGLFQMDGGASSEPIYEIGSPLYPEVTIDLGGRYGRGKTFRIIARNASRLNKYVQSARLNGKPLTDFYFPASALLSGGVLELQMGPLPNKAWGITSLPRR